MYGIDDAELPPNPAGGPLELKVRCYVDPEHNRPRTHPILLLPDWSVDTGHDLEAERFSVAFGGYLSCLSLADQVGPALRAYVQRHLRRGLPAIELGVSGRWNLTHRVDGCCAGYTSHTTAALAAEHHRSPRHVATEFGGARVGTVKALGKQVLVAHGTADPAWLPREALKLVGVCVRTRPEVEMLWEAGLTPELIKVIHDVAGLGRVLPANFYLGVVSRRPDLKWIHDSAAKAPGREVHDYLAWTETPEDRANPSRRGDWLGLGLSLRDVSVLGDSRYLPADVEELAVGLRRSTTSAGALLANWVIAECFPTIPALIAVCQMSDCGPDRVTRTAVDVVADLTGRTGPREQFAFALTLCGAPSLAASVIHATNSLQPADLLRGLDDWESARQKRNRVHA